MNAMHERARDRGSATLDLPEWSLLLRLCRWAEQRCSMPGLASFLMAKAKQVSDGVPSALHGGTVGSQTFERHRHDPVRQRYFSTNPWWPREHENESLEPHWAFLGGWFGLPPAVALVTVDQTARRHDPAFVFVPELAVAYATDRVVRLATGPVPLPWDELWRRWGAGLPSIGFPPSRRDDTLLDSLRRAERHGADVGILEQTALVDDYPGFQALARSLRASKLELVR